MEVMVDKFGKRVICSRTEPVVIPLAGYYGERKDMAELKWETRTLKGIAFTQEANLISERLISKVTVSFGENSVACSAMWDTGSPFSLISKKVVDKLGLSPTGSREVSGFDGHGIKDTYEAKLMLPANIIFPRKEFIEGWFNDSEFEVVIGMDVIWRGDFAVSNADRTMFTYRVSSREEFDFTKE